MLGITTIDRHTRLLGSVAERLGIDLEEEVLRGHLSPEGLHNSVFCCVGCSESDSCDHWLAVQPGAVETAPDYCRNKTDLTRLARS
ncbi:MAG: hypothetical protein HUJ27_03865 [Rhodobacteraceae bacterium]|nr:hypothetical protein [Paracoccaceae bacterium]